MTDNLDAQKVKWLTYMIYFLLTVLTVMTGWNSATISGLPEKYVRLERYQCDTTRVEKTLQSMNSKLDRLVERAHGDN